MKLQDNSQLNTELGLIGTACSLYNDGRDTSGQADLKRVVQASTSVVPPSTGDLRVIFGSVSTDFIPLHILQVKPGLIQLCSRIC
jgi:hypothetical protein